ncbi:hypothetical protein [Desulfomarina profundi]|nr:hypothetical protein [Desulfomarina profundi]
MSTCFPTIPCANNTRVSPGMAHIAAELERPAASVNGAREILGLSGRME